jgi:hypothetical protein
VIWHSVYSTAAFVALRPLMLTITPSLHCGGFVMGSIEADDCERFIFDFIYPILGISSGYPRVLYFVYLLIFSFP